MSVERSLVVASGPVSVLPVRGLPEIHPGDDLGTMILDAVVESGVDLEAWDVVVVTQKVVSKAEGAVVDLATVSPSARALELAAQTGLEPRLAEVVLSETTLVVRAEPGVLLCETRHGHVTANAAVDHSNVDLSDAVTVLPRDPDASAARLRDAWLRSTAGGPLAVIVSDTFGRPFRHGIANVAVGVAGMPALSDHTGLADSHGQVLRGTVIASADEVAAAAELVMGKTERIPVAVVRGLRWTGEATGVGPLLRRRDQDIFRRDLVARVEA